MMNNSIGISVNFASSFGLMEFEFADFCSSCSTTGITINGQSSSPAVQLTALDGTSLGGSISKLYLDQLPCSECG
jgi:hypothetical protein